MGIAVAENYEEKFGEKFQDHILAVAMKHPGFIQRFRTALNHEFFGNDQTRAIAKVLFSHVDQFQILPTTATLIAELKEISTNEKEFEANSAFCEKLAKREIRDFKAVIAKTVEFGKTQALCNACLEAADKIIKGKRHEVPGIMQKAALVGEDILDMGIDYVKASRLDWYTKDDAAIEMIPTGIRHLDLALGGGLRRGELGVVLAPPKRGKSTYLQNVTFGALVNPARLCVVYFSLEMGQKQIGIRIDDRLLGSLYKVKKSDPFKYVKFVDERVSKFILGKLFIKQYPTRSASVTTMKSYLSLLAAQDIHPDLIIVDYGDIVKPERRMGELRHEQAGVYEDLRTMAGEYNCAVWTASQGKSGSLEKETMDLTDFAESFEKSAIVDAAIALCQTQDEKIDRKCRLVAIALRNAQDGVTVECDIERHRCFIKSTALLDIANTRIDEDEEEGGGEDKEEKGVKALESIAKNQSAASAADKVKAEMGMNKAPAAKKGFKQFAAKKGGLKKEPKAMPERITKKVPKDG